MRTAEISRDTNETKIKIAINLDGTGQHELNSGVPFFDHMLHQIARHGVIDLKAYCDGDTHIDDHHSVEDVGIALGQAFAQAIGDKAGIRRYGHSYVPLDESLSRVVIDFSGRPGLYFYAQFCREKVGNFDTELVREFFQGFVNHAQATFLIDNICGENAQHKCKTISNAFVLSVRMALESDPRNEGVIPSTKGVL